jgi:hypothetical protein
MKKPKCRICLADDLCRIAKTIDMPDRGVLVTAAADMRMRQGCVHLAKDGAWPWNACGRVSRNRSSCHNPEHVTCLQCLARLKKSHG